MLQAVKLLVFHLNESRFVGLVLFKATLAARLIISFKSFRVDFVSCIGAGATMFTRPSKLRIAPVILPVLLLLFLASLWGVLGSIKLLAMLHSVKVFVQLVALNRLLDAGNIVSLQELDLPSVNLPC